MFGGGLSDVYLYAHRILAGDPMHKRDSISSAGRSYHNS